MLGNKATMCCIDMSEIRELENRAWTRVISSQKSKWSLNLRELAQYKDLLFLIVRRDFVAIYKQTILGPLWFFIQPIFTAYTYYLILTRMGGVETDGIPPFLFYVSGITIWNYFRTCLMKTSGTFSSNADMFSKVYFPRLIMPVSSVITQFISFAIQMLLLVVFIVYYHFDTNYTFVLSYKLLLLPLIVLLIAIISLSLGLLISAWTTKYRDLKMLLGFGIQLLMYFSAVVVPISQVDKLSGTMATLIEFNPIAQLVTAFKTSVLGVGDFNWEGIAYSGAVSIILLLLGILAFNKTEKTFIDTV